MAKASKRRTGPTYLAVQNAVRPADDELITTVVTQGLLPDQATRGVLPLPGALVVSDTDGDSGESLRFFAILFEDPDERKPVPAVWVIRDRYTPPMIVSMNAGARTYTSHPPFTAPPDYVMSVNPYAKALVHILKRSSPR